MFENEPENWMERRDYPDLDDQVERLLREAALHWEDPETAENLLRQAQDQAPDHIQVHISMYKFLFYTHQYEKAADCAMQCIELILQKRQIHKPMIALCKDDAPFETFDPELRFLMNAMMAYGYCLLRQGQNEKGKAVLDVLAQLDSEKQTSVLSLINIVDKTIEEAELN